MFTVTAGVVPGELIPDYTRQWFYTSADYEGDIAKPQDEQTTFTAYMTAAHGYAQAITDPRRLNWVKVEWIWV